MLVDDKFMFISLPRCASKSFTYSCVKYGIKVNHFDPIFDNESGSDDITHPHERLTDLIEKFGSDYPIISIRRNRHERFISLWKQVINEVKNRDIAKILQKFTVDDILYFKESDVLSRESTINLVDDFLGRHDLKKYNPTYLSNLLFILFNPTSFWHNNNPNIKWFDINNLKELELWVSDMLDMDFKLGKINTSSDTECSLELSEEYINKYNHIYDIYDLSQKNKKSVI